MEELQASPVSACPLLAGFPHLGDQPSLSDEPYPNCQPELAFQSKADSAHRKARVRPKP